MNRNYSESCGFGVARRGKYVPAGAQPAAPQRDPAVKVPRIGEEPDCNPGRGCGSEAGSRFGVTNRPVGMVYAPLQSFDGIYEKAKALTHGTIFAALDLPFEACGASGGGVRRG